MKIIKIIKKICGIFCCIMAIVGLDLAFTETQKVPFIIEVVIFAILAFVLLKRTPAEREERKRKQREKEEQKQKSVFGTHVSGLDIPNATLSVSLSREGVVISVPSMNKDFKLSLDKIQHIGYYSETEIERHLKSSLASGVLGAAVFGVNGAIIGSRAREKEVRKTTYYLLIDHSDGQIVIESENSIGVDGMIRYFKELKPESDITTTVEL